MHVVKVVSLDVTGTLVSDEYVKHFWESLIPMTYATENNVSFEEALSYVSQRYRMVSQDDVRWYLPEYWVDELKILKSLQSLLAELKPHVAFFPEVEKVLKKLYSEYELIVSSNLPKDVLEVLLGGFKTYFSKVFSSVSTYSLSHKTAEFYAKICADVMSKPNEVLHIGDNVVYDFLVPRVIGMKSLLVKRYQDPRREYEVKTLEQVIGKLKCPSFAAGV